MDGNKDEALRCLAIAEEAIAAGNKQRALRFIKFAQRLNRDSSVDDLLAACEKLASGEEAKSRGSGGSTNPSSAGKSSEGGSIGGERSYSEENLQLIRQINRTKDYYAILSVTKSCSVEEIRKSYRKLSLRVHPDKNKAPGAEEAFKKVCAAFKCLSDGESRRQYDHVGLVRGFDCSSSSSSSSSQQQRQNVRPRRPARRNEGFRGYNGYYDDDDTFGQYFNRNEGYRAYNPYRGRRERATEHNAEFDDDNGRRTSCWLILMQVVPLLVIFLLAFLPYTEPVYSLQPTSSYWLLRKTEKHGVEFYVKSQGFDQSYPVGSSGRSSVESSVVKDYKNLLWRYCHVEMQRRHWNKVLPTPNCNKLHNLGLA